MDTKELSRRSMISRAGVALGGAVVGASILDGCASGTRASSAGATQPAGTSPAAASPRVADFPYERHLPSGYRLDPAPIREAGYHAYHVGGCCHGAFSALVGHLATTAGAPFDQLPLDFGKFGGGGVAGYGSICGAVLGSVLVVNMVVANPGARNTMMTDLMRWYEGNAFPAYVPATADAAETGLTLDFSAANLPRLQKKPESHLCHASVSGWCAANRVSAVGADKKARCARLTADVAGKAAEMLNAYLASHAYIGAAMDGSSSACTGCHTPTSTTTPVAAGMRCGSCHEDELKNHP
jgi:Putative redox-active protein (C_GCAxxG_C_C)